MSVEWRSLPPELVESIARKLTILADYIRFRAVSGAWRSSTLPIPNHLPCQFPWLMLPQSGNSSYRRAFFDLANNKIHHLNLPELSHQYRRRFCGSSHGWFTILEESPCVFLFNPLTRERINLPPLSSFPNVVSFDFAMVGREYLIRRLDMDFVYSESTSEMRDSFINKIILSEAPGSSFVALAVIIPMDVLAYCKNGDNAWKYIEETRSFTADVTYLNGLFYAVNRYGEIAVCDLRGDMPVVEFFHTPVLTLEADTQYLVNLMGELLLVTRFLELPEDFDQVMGEFPYKTSDFRLFKLDSAQQKWEEMTSVDNMVLFLGSVSSLALKASEFPGCKGNKIYFLDDHFDSYYYIAHGDTGVFDLDDRSFDQLPCCPSNSDSQLLWPPPVWITPNLC